LILSITDIFNEVYKAVIAEFPNADLATHYVNQPANFPHVQLWIESDTTSRSDLNLSGDECFSNAVIHFEWFDNLLDGVGITNVKRMVAITDSIMRHKGYRRTYYAPVPNYQDATIYREIARYSGKQPNNT